MWETLGVVKTEFAKYAGILAKVKRKLQEASNTVDDAERRTNVLQSKLRHIESSPDGGLAEFPDLSVSPEAEDDQIIAVLGVAPLVVGAGMSSEPETSP